MLGSRIALFWISMFLLQVRGAFVVRPSSNFSSPFLRKKYSGSFLSVIQRDSYKTCPAATAAVSKHKYYCTKSSLSATTGATKAAGGEHANNKNAPVGGPADNNKANFSTRTNTTDSSNNSTTTTSSSLDPSTAPLKSLISPDFLSRFEWGHEKPPPDRYLQLPKNQRVVIMGDVHGDVDALYGFLVLAGAIETTESITWTGNDTILISLGDILDRGNEELECLEILAELSRQASTHGGAIHMLHGNHESLNAAGLFQYALEGGNDEFESTIGAELDRSLSSDRWRLQFAGNEPSRWAAMEPGGILSETTLQYCQVAIQVGRTVCVHAGLTKQHLDDYGGIEGMNKQAREWILKSHHGDNNNFGKYESVEAVIQSAQARAKMAAEEMPECLGGGIGSHSPVWMRDYSQPNDAPPRNPKAQAMIDEVLSELNADRLVMGHTPQFHINAALNGKAWRVDVGASKGVMGANPQVLEIIHGGEDEPDTVNVITTEGRVPGTECHIVESIE